MLLQSQRKTAFGPPFLTCQFAKFSKLLGKKIAAGKNISLSRKVDWCLFCIGWNYILVLFSSTASCFALLSSHPTKFFVPTSGSRLWGSRLICCFFSISNICVVWIKWVNTNESATQGCFKH